jgi:hypothetical protein
MNVYIGIDVAGPGEDETVVCVRQDNRIIKIQSFKSKDPRGEVLKLCTEYRYHVQAINIDSIGIGYYMYQHLRDVYKGRVIPINVGSASANPEKFINLKAELYWDLRKKFEDGVISNLMDDKTIAQLASIRFDTNSRGKTLIESKKDARKRGVTSPDRAEALMLCFARPQIAGANVLEFYRRNTELPKPATVEEMDSELTNMESNT